MLTDIFIRIDFSNLTVIIRGYFHAEYVQDSLTCIFLFFFGTLSQIVIISILHPVYHDRRPSFYRKLDNTAAFLVVHDGEIKFGLYNDNSCVKVAEVSMK